MTALCNLQVQITDQPLTSLEMMDTGRICAVGAADGSTTIVQFSDGLVDLQPNEKQALTSVSTFVLSDVPHHHHMVAQFKARSSLWMHCQ